MKKSNYDKFISKIIKNNKTKMSKRNNEKKGLYIQLMPILNMNMKTIK